MLYIIGENRKEKRVITAMAEEIIENALQQEREGIEPCYSFYDGKRGEKVTPTGWLVWSSYDYGCGVVYRRKDGKMIIATGVQGDFCYC